MVRGSKSGHDTPYDIGDLDLAFSAGGLELAQTPENSQAMASDNDDEDARFYASLPTSSHAHHTEPSEDDDAMWADLPSLELAHDPRSLPETGQPRRSSLRPAAPATPVLAARSASIAPSATAATGVRLFTLPELGAPPSAVWNTPVYALRAAQFTLSVWRTRRALRDELAEAQNAAAAALVELGRALISLRHAAELQPLQAKFLLVDAQLAQRSSVATAFDVADATRSSLEAQQAEQLAQMREAREPFAERARMAAAASRQADADVARAEAQTRRAEIALRAVKQAASPPAGTTIEELESALRERQDELTLVRTARTRAAATAFAEQRELDALLAKERAEVQKHALALAEADKRKSALGKRIALVGASEEAALRALAQSARELKLAHLSRAACENADKCARLVAAIESDSERVARAMTLVHGQRVWTGLGVCVALLALFLCAAFG